MILIAPEPMISSLESSDFILEVSLFEACGKCSVKMNKIGSNAMGMKYSHLTIVGEFPLSIWHHSFSLSRIYEEPKMYKPTHASGS